MKKMISFLLLALALALPAHAQLIPVFSPYLPAGGFVYDTPSINNVQTGSGNSTSISMSYTVSSITNRILVVAVGVEDAATDEATACTFNTSETMTASTAAPTQGAGISNSVRLFYLINPTATTANIDCTISGTQTGGTDEQQMIALTLGNVAQQAPTNEASGQGTTSPVDTSISATPTNGIVVDAAVNGNLSNFTATGTGHNEQSEFDDASTTMSVGTKLFTSSGTQTIGWTVATVNRRAWISWVFEASGS